MPTLIQVIAGRCGSGKKVNYERQSHAGTRSVLGVFYLTITVARLVTLELEDRRR